jgi:hypothetical protein
MISGILLLAIVIFGLQVLFGARKPENYYKFLIFLIVAPILLAIGANHAIWLWSGLPLWMQVASILLLPFLISALLRVLLPNARWASTLQDILFNTGIYLVTFPIRFLWRAARFVLNRERQPNVRFNPYRPVVGTRPPTINNRGDNRDDRNNPLDW